MDMVERLRAERQALAERLKQIDRMLDAYDEWGREAQRLFANTQAKVADEHFVVDAPTHANVAEATHTTSPQAELAKTPMKEFESAVIDVLRLFGRPMDRLALYDALTTRGVVIGGHDRIKDLNTLSARIYRMAQGDGPLTNERGEGYSLKEATIYEQQRQADDTNSGGESSSTQLEL